jgi:hypothetical protein
VLERRKLGMSIILAVTTRVRVRSDPDFGPGPWPAEPIGTITAHPIDGAPFTWADTTSGPVRQYWVVFDSPQFDANGDGPYVAGEVLARYIEPLEESERDSPGNHSVARYNISLQNGKLSHLALIGIASALIALANYERWLPLWLQPSGYWPWVLFAFSALANCVVVVMRLAAGEKWT